MSDTPDTPVLPYPEKLPLFKHASGQWAKKIKGKIIYFGTDQAKALDRYEEYRARMEAGLPVVRVRRLRQSTARPSADFPLFLHATGQWAKKIRGKLHYFGTDADAAKNKYLEQRDDLQAGRIPKSKQAAGLSLRDGCNLHLTAMKGRRSRGEITTHTFNDCHTTCGNLIQFLGENTLVENLRPEDFARYGASPGRSGKARSLITFGNLVIRTRTVFNWLFDNDHIQKPMKFGTEFEVPNRQDKAKAKAKRPPASRMITAAEILKILDAAKQPMKSMILLGVNAGFGQNDCACLPLSAIDLNAGWITFPRPKTGTQRKCPLWPETIASLKEAIDNRPTPKGAEEADLVFLTHRGARWVRHQEPADAADDEKQLSYFNDHLAPEFNKLLVKLGIKRRGSFYNLRHVFRTVAGAAKDREAIDVIMGHTDQSMGAHYVEDFDDDRLVAVVNVVHRWLFPQTASEPANASTEIDGSILPFRATAG
jgi:Phage integrase family